MSVPFTTLSENFRAGWKLDKRDHCAISGFLDAKAATVTYFDLHAGDG